MPDKKPAILQVIPQLDAGGAERTTVEIAAALSQAGYTALVASQGGRMEGELKAAGGELIRMKMASKSPLKILSNAMALKSLIAARDIKLIHARSRAPAWSALMAARMTHIPFVTTYHGIYNSENSLKHFYNSVMMRGDAVIANSQWTADHVLREHRELAGHVHVIPRGVDLSRFDPGGIAPDAIAAQRTQWGAGDGDLVILLPGRMTRWKGQLLFLDALAQLRREGLTDHVRAVLIGDAQGRHDYVVELRRAIVRNRLEKTAIIADHVSDMATAYLAADVVVSASTEPEAFGRVAAEAAAMGRPVVATDHGGARETVLNGASGLLVRPNNADALADGLAKMIRLPPDSRADMGRAGRAHVARTFTLDRMTGDTLALYRSLTGT
ncbi:MAG TPA: glycosyltransferase family 4 protein [Rhizomicrobium sp.]|nr:glycosyltransferase family 4 protein [Rhizomicrobium sp.]